jgi:hypothetical protein
VLIFASIDEIAPAKAGALRGYLSAFGVLVNRSDPYFLQYFNEVG